MFERFYFDAKTLEKFYSDPSNRQSTEVISFLSDPQTDIAEVALEIFELFEETIDEFLLHEDHRVKNLNLAIDILRFVNSQVCFKDSDLPVEMLRYNKFQVFHLAMEIGTLDDMEYIWGLVTSDKSKKRMLTTTDFLACQLAAKSADKLGFVLEKAQALGIGEDVMINAFYHAYQSMEMQKLILDSAVQITGLKWKIITFMDYSVFQDSNEQATSMILSYFDEKECEEILAIVEEKYGLLKPKKLASLKGGGNNLPPHFNGFSFVVEPHHSLLLAGSASLPSQSAGTGGQVEFKKRPRLQPDSFVGMVEKPVDSALGL